MSGAFGRNGNLSSRHWILVLQYESYGDGWWWWAHNTMSTLYLIRMSCKIKVETTWYNLTITKITGKVSTETQEIKQTNKVWEGNGQIIPQTP